MQDSLPHPALTNRKEARQKCMYLFAMAGKLFRCEIRPGLLAMAITIASSLPAASQHAKAPDAPCKSAGSENLRTHCFIAYARRSDRELDWITRVLARGLKPEQAAEFGKAETYWHQFREANCDAERDLFSELAPADLAYAACAEVITRQRVVELKMMYSWLFK